MPGAITHIVDASALVAYFKGEAGHERNIVAIHAVNLCEVYYGYLRSDGLVVANEAWDRASKLVGILKTMDEDFVKRVGRWKVEANLGLGDSFLAASAEEHAAILLTADHTHFDPIQQAGAIQIEFIR